ncbi:MAG: GlcNAc-PI de-N-acetylase [Chloroflexi bacterium]|nr:GlcNAc-PI de-N-acetylase [Chloroflexota bacterium]
MSDRRILIAYAHPDDEAFGLGAVIARYVDAGVDVYLICATNGDVGTVSPEQLNGYQSVAELRLSELDCAAAKLRLKQVFTFGYKDSGMMGSETSRDPACLWQADPAAVTRRIVAVIRAVQPQVVITFNRYGGYGHPDHIAIQRATIDAFALAADPAYSTDQPPYQAQKLYASSIPQTQLKIALAVLRLRGQDPRKLGKNKDIDLRAVLDHIEPTHAIVDIRDYHRAWDEAGDCHRSQQGGGPGLRFPYWLRRRLIPWQGFTRLYPIPLTDQIDETDLFANVRSAVPTAPETAR